VQRLILDDVANARHEGLVEQGIADHTIGWRGDQRGRGHGFVEGWLAHVPITTLLNRAPSCQCIGW
jgi:hypothetical protein